MRDLSNTILYMIIIILLVASIILVVRSYKVEHSLWREVIELQSTPDFVPAPQDIE